MASFMIGDVIANLLQNETYAENQDVMVEIIEVLHVIVKELIESIPSCMNDVRVYENDDYDRMKQFNRQE